MIKNERQYRITKAEAGKFALLIEKLQAKAGKIKDPFAEAEIAGLRSQMEDLQSQVEEYDDLRAGKEMILETESLSQLPQALVKARIAAGLSQKELAARLNLKEQQIQKYEATDYAGASVSRLLEVADALKLKVRKDVFLPSTPSFDVFKRLADMGIERDFVLRRLVSPSVAAKAQSPQGAKHPEVVFEATTATSHIFGWTPQAVIGTDPLLFDGGVLGATRFKVNKRAEEKRLSAYTFYAHFIALQLMGAIVDLPPKPVPVDFRVFRTNVLHRYGELTFKSVLNYVWDLGIAVLPLKDRGAFHGAMWRVKGRNLMALKQTTTAIDRWLHDLLHETYHAGQEPHLTERTLIEASETSQERRESDEEWDATEFAANVALDGRAETLAQQCVEASRGGRHSSGSVARLKTVVPQVANAARVSVGALANYMAFRLSLQNIDWWGTAQNLQDSNEDPWEIARDVLLQRVQLHRVHGLDRELLLRALSEPEVE